jgi:DNA-binding MarR family transcriptional regulator
VVRQRSSLLFDFFAAGGQVRELLRRTMAGSPLTADEYGVYSGVFEFEPITPSDLALTVGMRPTTLTHYLIDMRERRHLDEQVNPEDGRSKLLRLTDSGRSTHRAANRTFEVAYSAFLSRIADEPSVKDALLEIEAAAREAADEIDVSVSG